MYYIITDSETDFKMRMRKKKHSGERIEACSALLLRFEPGGSGYSELSGSAEVSREIFGASMPLELEIGCGKGDFAVGLSAAHPASGIIAVERVADVAVTALEKAAASADARPDNLRFIIGNAQDLEGMFPENTFSRIYLNFSDPWPKARHAKRRLTYRGRLQNYKKVLKPDGFIEFKTDNEGLFAFTLEEIEACGYEMIEMSRDLHGEAQGVHGEKSRCFMTEYEEKFSGQGKNINFVRF